jgi:hypothetical protein
MAMDINSWVFTAIADHDLPHLSVHSLFCQARSCSRYRGCPEKDLLGRNSSRMSLRARPSHQRAVSLGARRPPWQPKSQKHRTRIYHPLQRLDSLVIVPRPQRYNLRVSLRGLTLRIHFLIAGKWVVYSLCAFGLESPVQPRPSVRVVRLTKCFVGGHQGRERKQHWK